MSSAKRLSLIYYPDPRLRRRCRPVARFDASLAAAAERMIELMREHHGVGLAAPQVGLDVRLFVCQPTEDAAPAAYVNPVLTLGYEMAAGEEGCLSLPEVTVSVLRATTCSLSACDVSGKPVRIETRGLLARVWQHECDHLDGRLIIERMTEAERIANRRYLKELERKYRPARKR